MRIVFVIPYFYDAWAYGGQPRSAFEMAKALVARGHVVEVLTTDSGGPGRLDIPRDGFTRTVDGIEIHYYRNLSNALAFKQRVFLPRLFFKEVNVRVQNADVVHIHELRSFLAASAASACVRRSIPFVISPHGGLRHLGRRGLKTAFDLLWGSKILRSAAVLMAVSPVERQDARNMKVPPDRIAMVPNSVPDIAQGALPDCGDFKARYGIRAERLLLFLGRLHSLKGADLLVEAFARMWREEGDAGLHLVIAGPDDGQRGSLRRLVERFKIAERVTFTGYLDQTRKLEALVDSSLVVVPSRSEVFAITALEALMCSRPVLMSSACGLYPMPAEQHGVLSFQAGSVEDLKSQLQRALKMSGLADAARRGKEFVESEFSSKSLGERLESVYAGIGKRNG